MSSRLWFVEHLRQRWEERQDQMTEEWLDRFHREHRWDALADYNREVNHGLVHTPEYVERMRLEQIAFDAEFRAKFGVEIEKTPISTDE